MTDKPQEDFAFPTAANPDVAPVAKPAVITPSEDAIDQGVEESFPASDPVSVTTDKARPHP